MQPPKTNVILRPTAEKTKKIGVVYPEARRFFGPSGLRMTHAEGLRMTRAYSFLFLVLISAGCTVKAVGDPNRPITINANVVIDIRGLKQTANHIEDMVAQGGAKS